MEYCRKCKRWIGIELLLILLFVAARQNLDLEPEAADETSGLVLVEEVQTETADIQEEAKEIPLEETAEPKEEKADEDYIRWVDFNISSEALSCAYEADVDTYGTDFHIDWISLLACTAARNGGEFGKQALVDLENTAERLQSGQTTLEEETDGLSSYAYYVEAYEAVLGGMVGEFLLQEEDEEGNVVWRRKYGLKAFSPIAGAFPYTDSDDFGAARSYGYARPHLGHDMIGQIGTPVTAVESGYVEALGWNEYGGWRIGIRSFDQKRYYYYAHLRQNYPYAEGLEEGSVVTAGDVIGYMGHTGYSETENVNNIETVHLHWGLELIFDESQKESDNEIWIDCYQLSRFLSKNRVAVEKVGESREWKRVYDMEDPAAESYLERME